MNLEEWTSGSGQPSTKPWLTPVVYSLEAGTISQKGGLPTPYGLFSCLSEEKTQSGTPVSLMGIVSGVTSIPAADITPGLTLQITASGTVSSPVIAAGAYISVRNQSGSYIYAEGLFPIGLGAVQAPWTAECKIQFPSVGAAGVAKMRSSMTTVSNANSQANVSLDSAVIDTTAGLDFYIYGYVNNITQGADVTRLSGVATVIY